MMINPVRRATCKKSPLDTASPMKSSSLQSRNPDLGARSDERYVRCARCGLYPATVVDFDLGGANLEGATLEGAYLEGAKNYSNSHDFWIEIIRRQKLDTFTDKEWVIIGQVYVHRLCWETIKKRYGEKITPIFKKLAKVGFGEFLTRWEEIKKG